MKCVAIQFYGLVRGFRFENTRNLFYERIIKQLEEQGYEVHIFWHTYDIMEAYLGKVYGTQSDFYELIEGLDKKKFNIKKIHVDSDSKLQDWLENIYKLEERYKFDSYWVKEFKYGWFKGPCYSEKMVNKLRNDYEKENNIKYEWIIMTNPQQEPQNNIDNLNVLNNNYMYSPNYAQFNGYYDSFFIGNSEHMNYIAELWDYMISKKFKNDENKNYHYFKNDYIKPEPILKQYIDSKYIMKDILNIRFNRVRWDGRRIDH